MSNLHRIRLGSVCPARPAENSSPEAAAKNIISAFEGVLADEAEFVLTPECFDIPQGLDADGLRAFCAIRGDAVLQALQKLARDNGYGYRLLHLPHAGRRACKFSAFY